MVIVKEIKLLSSKVTEFTNITQQVLDIVENSNIKNGIVVVLTTHTTTGIMVNESLPCVEVDMEETLDRLIPYDAGYAHAHFLSSYGATGNNSPGHLKSMLSGNNCIFPVIDGKVVRGGAQDIYFVEFDGPQTRRIIVEVMGE